VTAAARYPGYALANFSPDDAASSCGHQVQDANFVVRKLAGTWKVLNSGGTISCPIPGVPDRVANALGIPC
jgi:hypothetical protein